MAKTAKAKAKSSKSVKKPMLPFEMGTIASDDEVPASESDASGDEAEDAENAGGSGESDGASSRGGFIFDDESAFGGTLGKSYGASAGPSWDFTAAMKVLADQGAKKPFVLLTEEHIAKQRDVAKKRIAKDRQDARKKKTGADVANKAAGEEEGAEVKAEGSDDENDDDDANSEDADESGDDDDEEDNDEVGEDDGVSDEEDSEDELGPAVEDEVRALGVTPAEAAAKLRADKKRMRGEANQGSEDEDDGDENDDEEEDEEEEEEKKEEPARKTKAKAGEGDGGQRRGVTVDDDAAAAEFFDTNSSFLEAGSSGGSGQDVYFSQLNLSRPLIRGVEAMGFVKPTPIQARVVPVALAGRDVCGSAVTGSGKTAAFLLPVLERLLYRPSGVAATRVLIVAPTRELAAQCHAMGAALARFVDPPIEFSLITGGTKNLRPQEAELRRRPDIVICTPGRMLDHVRNSQGVHLDDVNVLVLDEVDRLLELGFKDEVEELVKMCPIRRQTLLFTATFNTTVEALTNLSLRKPVRVGVDVQGHVAGRLNQEFIRIKEKPSSHASPNMCGDRAATLCALVTRTFKKSTIVFFDTKVEAHRFGLLLGLLGVRVAELHGDLTQLQRLAALEQFRAGEADVLLATDLAARGLDIPLVQTVINYEMPRQPQTYVHRVGRTARAGRGGRSITLIGEARRLVMKEVLRDMDVEQREAIKTRAVAPNVVLHFRQKCQHLQGDLETLLQDEGEAKEMRVAEMHLQRAENLVEKDDEIASRPQRTWFQSEKMKTEAKTKSKAALEPPPPPKTPAQRLKALAKDHKKGAGEGGGKIESGTHRLSRKKRRRLERLADMDFAAAEDEVAEQQRKQAKANKQPWLQMDGNGGEDTMESAGLSLAAQAKRKVIKSDVSMAELKADKVTKASKRSAKLKRGDLLKLGRGDEVVSRAERRAADRGEEKWGAEQEQMMRDLNRGGDGYGGPGSGKKRRGVKVVLEGGESNGDGGGGGSGSSGAKESKKGSKDGKKDSEGDKLHNRGEFQFKDFDPMRVRIKKGNQPRSGSFKSKQRYKRR